MLLKWHNFHYTHTETSSPPRNHHHHHPKNLERKKRKQGGLRFERPERSKASHFKMELKVFPKKVTKLCHQEEQEERQQEQLVAFHDLCGVTVFFFFLGYRSLTTEISRGGKKKSWEGRTGNPKKEFCFS